MKDSLNYPDLQGIELCEEREKTGGAVNIAFERDPTDAVANNDSQRCRPRQRGLFGNSIRTTARFEDQQVELLKGKNGGERLEGGTKGSSQDETSSDTSQFPEFLNYGEEDEMEIEGFKRSLGRTIVTWMFIIATGGLLRLIFHWWPRLMLLATHQRCPLSEAEKVLIMELYQQKYKRFYVKTVYSITSDLFRTTNLFTAAGLRSTRQNDANSVWDQKLEEELNKIPSPKLVLPKQDGSVREMDLMRLFSCKKLRYIWDEQYAAFTKLQGFDIANTHLLHQSKGLSIFQQCQRRIIYGSNEIKVEVQSIVKLLFLEVLNPFYVFQIFSITLWLTDNYIYFAVAIIIMSVLGIASTIIQTRKNQAKLQATVQSSDIIKVCREGGEFEDIPTEHLVPGDVIVIPPHRYTMHCDAVLLSGNCIVNESMLTGESVPVTKIPLPNRNDIFYTSKEHARHTLFCGTHIIQTRYYGHEPVLAVVVRSGFLTAKGNLVRSIMYPPPVDYRFERDSYKFVAVLGCIAVCGFIYSVFVKLSHGVSVKNIIVDSLDLITIVVPPALPAAMTVGRLYAQRRLQQKGIYCISPRAINVAGSLDCVCFDKTGTLTEEGLDMWGAVPTTTGSGMGSNYGAIYPSLDTSHGFLPPVRHANNLPNGSLLVGMAACHSLTRIDGDLIGDPLDLKMFEWTGWLLEEPGVADNEKFDMVTPTVVRPPAKTEVNDNMPTTEGGKKSGVGCEVGIVRQFPFSSSLQRMSVITRRLGAPEFELFCKGSPEMIVSLSLPETIPENFTATLERYTQHGYRVIAMGFRKLSLNYAKAQRVVREEVESNLVFLGLIVLENRLKPETTDAIAVHKNAGIRTIMVTGDNMLTAISVARECRMIEQEEKVIVVTTEADKTGVEAKPSQKQTLMYSYATKAGAADAEGTQSPVSVGSGCGSMMEQNLINVETPANRYHFAITGNAFSVAKSLSPEILPRLLVRGTVFARMNPDQKQQLVEHLQGLGYFVAMCGDGANDCGALKAAHAGISLSEAESSVASPFTSREANITCVPNLIREGRAALVTSFGIFKYMAIYSLTQFISVILLYTIDSNLADLQFLYIDLFLISIFAFTFGHTEPDPGPLVKQPPSANLVSAPPVLSILTHMLSTIGMQVLAFLYIQQQPWHKTFVPKDEYDVECLENYAVFSVSAFQYIIMAVVFSQGSPYRKGFWTNKYFMLALVSLVTLTTYIVVYPDKSIAGTLELILPPNIEFRLILLGFAACNFIIAVLIEQGFVNFILSKRRSNKPSAAKQGYLKIDHELSMREDWPSVASPNGSENGTGVDFSKRKMIFSNDNKAKTLERPSSLAARPNGVGGGRRHSSSVSIPIPMADYLGLQPRLLAAATTNNQPYNASIDSESIATHINNCLNSANLHTESDIRIPLGDVSPPNFKS